MLRKTYFRVFHCFFLRESLFWLKREVLCKYPQKCFKTTEMHSLAVIGSFWREKQHLLIFVPFYWFDQKQLFKQIQIFLRINPFKHEKQTFGVFLCAFLRYSFFGLKREDLYEFPPNCFKTSESTVWLYVAHFEEKKYFFLIFHPFYCFDQKHLFKQIQILIFSNLLRQTNFLSISLLLLRLSLFGLQREVLWEFPKNCFKTTEKHSLAVYSSLCGEKQFLLIFIHFYWFD